MDLHIEEPELQHFGIFETCSLKSLQIAPRTVGDAKIWYVFLIIDGISTYMTETLYLEHIEKQRELFARFGYELEAPSIQDAIERFSTTHDDKTYHPIYWYLNTPKDLCLREGE